MEEKIKILRSQGMTYQEIADELQCAKSTISYYLGPHQKQKSKLRTQKNRLLQHPYTRKVENFTSEPLVIVPKNHYYTRWQNLITLKIQTFCRTHGKGTYMKQQFNYQDVLNKFGENPKCYLTGEPINIYEPRTYHFDHKIPRSRGGDNSIENLGICTKVANQSKQDLTEDEFINLCRRVLENKGYQISGP